MLVNIYRCKIFNSAATLLFIPYLYTRRSFNNHFYAELLIFILLLCEITSFSLVVIKELCGIAVQNNRGWLFY